MRHSLQSLLALQATPRGWQYTGLWTIFLLLFLLQPIHSTTVDVTITSDNAYLFGFGDVYGITPGSLYGGVENCLAADIFSCATGPETYLSIPAALDGYLYIVAWSDEAVYQGTIAQFTDGLKTILTKPGLPTPWEVFATGIDVDPRCPTGQPPPTLAAINSQIALANASAGGAGSSVTWVNENSAGSNGRLEFDQYINYSGSNPDPPFPPGDVCGIGPAQWMWYNPDPATISDPFTQTVSGEYLIFRIGPLGPILDRPIPTLTEWGMIIFCVLLFGWMAWVIVRRRRRVTIGV